MVVVTCLKDLGRGESRNMAKHAMNSLHTVASHRLKFLNKVVERVNYNSHFGLPLNSTFHTCINTPCVHL